MPEQEESSFKVTDRRKYNPDGSPRDTGESQTVSVPAKPEPTRQASVSATDNVVSFPNETAPTDTTLEQTVAEPVSQPAVDESQTTQANVTSDAEKAAASQAERDYNSARGPASPGLPEASFLGLVNMLAVEAAMHLGLLRTAGEEPPPVDLESGRHLIDMLGMLQTKTRGNLTTEEDELLENVLADLRMQFVAISRKR
jgi:uncharacterized protein DUF1844